MPNDGQGLITENFAERPDARQKRIFNYTAIFTGFFILLDFTTDISHGLDTQLRDVAPIIFEHTGNLLQYPG